MLQVIVFSSDTDFFLFSQLSVNLNLDNYELTNITENAALY